MRSTVVLCLFSGVVATSSALGEEPRPFLERQLVPNEVLIKLHHALPSEPGVRPLDSTGDPELDQVLRARGLAQLSRVFPEPPRGWKDPLAARESGLDRWVVARGDEALVLRPQDVQALQGSQSRHSIEQPSIGQFFDTLPNDPLFPQMWSLQNDRLQAPRAWDVTTQCDTVVAVLDSGIDIGHDDLEGNRWVNRGEIHDNGVDDDNNGYVDDRKGWDFDAGDRIPEDNLGHGIHTSGTVGAIGDNGIQCTGIAWELPVMTLKIGDFGIDWARAAEGIVYAVDNGASVLSMSWGDISPIDVVEDALDYATSQDVLPVAAAGNFGTTSKAYPAAYAKVMAVISTNSADQRSSFSTYGVWCDLAAPGEDILGLFLNNSTAHLSGTSMACPHVAGVAGLVRHVNPMLDWRDTRWVLNDSAQDLGPAGFDNSYGWGRLDARQALDKARMLRVSTNRAAPGDAVQIDLHQDGAGGHLHVLLASLHGKQPGIDLGGFDPAETRFLRLNHDPILVPYILRHPGAGGGIFQRFVETFDAGGDDQATLVVPGGNAFLGRRIGLGFVSFDPADLSQISGVSNSSHVDVR